MGYKEFMSGLFDENLTFLEGISTLYAKQVEYSAYAISTIMYVFR